MQIACVFYRGTVPNSQADEYVEMVNLGGQPQELVGWVLWDIADGTPSFTFPAYLLAPGARIRVYTNQVHQEWGGFSFGRGIATWNDSDPDRAALRNAEGVVVSELSYPPGC